MRYSKLFGKTRHEPPCDADSVNAKYLTQSGFIEKMAAGIYNILPLGHRVLSKINDIIEDEMDKIDGQRLLLPALHPIDLWKTTGRDVILDDILYRTHAGGDKEFIFGPSHEEAITPLVAKYIQSYKDLPLSLYQIQTKYRDEPRAKSGMLRGREFGMKDMYSFHTDEEDLEKYYERAIDAYLAVFDRCGLKAHVIEASGGAFSDKFSHEFAVETAAGEDTIIVCDKCKSAQNLEIAEGKIKDPEDNEEEKEMELVDIERGFSVKENADAHNVPEHKILKTVVYEVEDEGLVGVVIRGDLNVSDVKLENYMKKRLKSADPAKLKELGLVQGYISPVNMPESIEISFIGDHSIQNVKNFVTGANEFAKDYKNANIGRDFVLKDFTDLVEVKGGFNCPKCDKELTEMTAVEVGNIFKLGTRFSEAFDLHFTNAEGKREPVVMGCYGIGNTRLMGTVVEASHDDKGIIWPKSIAPYTVQLVTIGNDKEVIDRAEKLYEDMLEADVEVLFDDRDVRPGVKLNDADLIGNPVRIIVSKRTMEDDGVEWKERSVKDPENVKFSELLEKIKAL